MFGHSLEKLFDRYRTRGDAKALAAVFDRTSGELFQLALHLVREPAEAEDVLQNTYLAAIQNAESYDAARPLVPWLVGILAKQASLARRRAAREVEPDRLDPRASEDPQERAALVEFSARLAEALDSLPEPYRQVLRLHLADGKKSIEIARELGRAPGTVRMQVHRGLELLRRALPAGFAAGAAALLLPTRGLAAVREVVLAEAARHAAAATSVATASAASGSGLSAAGSIAIAIAALAAGSVALFVAERSGSPSTVEESSVASIEPESASAGPTPLAPAAPERSAPETIERRALEPSAEPEPPAAEPAPPAPPAARWLVGSVRGAHPESPIALEVRAITRFTWPEDAVVRGAPDAQGNFRLDVSELFQHADRANPLEELVLDADEARSLRARVRVPLARDDARSEFRADVDLSPAGLVRGRARCLGSHDAPIQVAALTLERGVPELPVIDSRSCAPDGSFTLRLRDGREHAVVALADGHRPALVVARVAPENDVELAELVLDPGAEITGSVARAGDPVEGAMVSARGLDSGAIVSLFGARLLWRDGALERAGTAADTDPGGRYRLAGLAPDKYQVQVARIGVGIGASAPLGASREVTAPDPACDFEIESARVLLTVLGAEDEPVRGSVRVLGDRTLELHLDSGGRARAEVAPSAPFEILVACEGHLPERMTLQAPAAGMEREEIVRLARDRAGASLVLDLELPQGLEVGEALVVLTPRKSVAGAEGTASVTRTVVLAGGQLALRDLPAGAFRAEVFAGGTYRHFIDHLAPAEIAVDLAAGRETRARLALALGGRLRLSATDESGAPLASACAVRDPSGRRLSVRFIARNPERVATSPKRLSELGPCDVFPNLRTGEYEITFNAEGRERVKLRVTVEPGATREVRAILRREGG